jgi:glucokinase
LALLGFDIGGTKCVLVVADHNARICARSRIPMRFSGDWRADLETLVGSARELLREAGAAGPLEGIGVAAPGPVDRASGVLLNPPNLPGWHDVPIRSVLAEAFGVPVRIENDANAAALAEHRFGAGRGVRDLVYLTMSTGVGGGVICNGELVRGASGFAGELGHLPIVRNGRRCACGLRGCLEAYVGGHAWARRLRRTAPETSRVAKLAAADRSPIGPEHLLAAARAGDAFACGELEGWLDHLALGIVPLVMAFDPDRIVLGTIAAAAGDALCFRPLRARVAARLWPHQAERLEIVPAALGEALPERAALAAAGARFGPEIEQGAGEGPGSGAFEG